MHVPRTGMCMVDILRLPGTLASLIHQLENGFGNHNFKKNVLHYDKNGIVILWSVSCGLLALYQRENFTIFS